MQERHSNRLRYFTELANTSKEFYIDYVRNYFPLRDGCKVLEIGCGEGGNLLPFAEIGCEVTGIDRSKERISQAKSFYKSLNYDVKFIPADFFEINSSGEDDKFDIILVHDVIEHIAKKDAFLKHLKQFSQKDGIIFWRFPAWQMPFGGHQQLCHNRFLSKFPFIHLLPESVFHSILTVFNEPQPCIDELIDIKRCRVSIEKFEKLIKTNNYIMINRCLWFINPHHKQKFNLKPRKVYKSISTIKYIRNFVSTSCYYITKCREI